MPDSPSSPGLEGLDDLRDRMWLASGRAPASGGTCTCSRASGTATWQEHDRLCAYRLICEAADAIATLITDCTALRERADRAEAERDEARAYLKAFCVATIDPDERGNDVGLHEANPFIEYEFALVDEDVRPERRITGGQVRRAMEIVGFDRLKIKAPARTIADELTEARDLRQEVPDLKAALAACRAEIKELRKTIGDVRDLVAEADATPPDWAGRRAAILDVTCAALAPTPSAGQGQGTETTDGR